jgi:hypothetical protein
MNRAYQHSGSLRALWPGHRWVSMVGIDAYFEHRRATFSYEFADTVARVRRITASPIMITETAGSPAIGKLRAVRLLLAGVHAYHLTGFVWFDVAQHGGISRRDWRLEGHPAAMAAFRGSVASVRKG